MACAKILLGDCKDLLKQVADHSVDLIITSPPYADSRKNTYGGVHPDRYVEWFLPVSKELLLVEKASSQGRCRRRPASETQQMRGRKLLGFAGSLGRVWSI
jgi:hypothetical protein